MLPTANDVTSSLLAAALYVLTLPIAGSMIARATYLTDESHTEIDTVDELAERRHHDATVDYDAPPATPGSDDLPVTAPPAVSPRSGCYGRRDGRARDRLGRRTSCA